MKVILLQDIANIGQKFEVKDVSDGFALNFLIPQGKAQFADKNTVERLKAKKDKEAEQKQKRDATLKEALEKQQIFEVGAKANEEGHLFAKIDRGKVAELLSEKAGQQIQQTQINMETPIKEVGDHSMGIQIGGEVVEVTIRVQSE